MTQYFKRAQESAQYIKSKIPELPLVAMVLGSGLGDYADQMTDRVVIPYQEIPGFLSTNVPGHKGNLVFGRIHGVFAVAMQGRTHFYEGYAQKDLVFPIRVLHLCGAKILLVTNAAGGINLDYHPGDLMLIEDHINFSGESPLTGPNEEDFGVRFPDMSQAYDKHLKELLLTAAQKNEIHLHRGVYIMFRGPQYETGAEIRMARTMGADAAGMSTVPEVIAARHAGMRIAGISCITNMAAGILDQPLSHEEVSQTANRTAKRFKMLIDGFFQLLANE